ncbi:MAG: DNA mismatch repair endonuclease MutL [Verrucomicrobiae bacterium]|nr:DNA mismatch repair endonuclease MutL [Verrucomicrobiae bacterium]
MNRIRLLSENVANQIAAGEVVERPASVVKELLENSLDAGSTRIEIEVSNGGRSLIRVNDNGCGMSKDDALLSLERHATSKISVAEDLDTIATLGFRGEAIPSIAAVCRFHMITREHDAGTGTAIHISGGKLHEVKEVGAPAGTTIEVRNLFFNLPARRKFLRSPPTEMAHINHIVTLHALAHPQVSFWLKQDDHIVFDVAPCKNLLDRIRELYGAQLCQELLPVQHQAVGVKISGFIGKPGVSRADRSQQHTFVNGRPVDSKTINFGLFEGYHTALMRGRYPVAFVFVEVDPGEVDVNIHPAKREVRFRDDREVRAVVVEAVRRAIEPAQVGAPKELRIEDGGSKMGVPTVASTLIEVSQPVIPPSQSSSPQTASLFPTSILHPPPSTPKLSTQHSALSTTSSAFDLRLLGVIGDLYVIAESKEGLVLVDQHAAHERVLFEQMLKRNDSQPVPSQKLLMPETIETDHRDAAFLRENLETLQHMGIGIHEFGDRTFAIDALPPFFKKGNFRQLFRNIVDELREAGRDVPRGRLSEQMVATTVCRHAVKANDPLKTEELIRLLGDLQRCDLPYTCPHGRPTMIQLSYTELEKKFGRKV